MPPPKSQEKGSMPRHNSNASQHIANFASNLAANVVCPVVALGSAVVFNKLGWINLQYGVGFVTISFLLCLQVFYIRRLSESLQQQDYTDNHEQLKSLLLQQRQGYTDNHEQLKSVLLQQQQMNSLLLLLQQDYTDKYEQMKVKYKNVVFKAVNSINEFTKAETRAVKIGLIQDVQHSVHGIYLVDKDLPLPMSVQDDKNYFDGNKEAIKRIGINHPNMNDRVENNIHRVFVISSDFLKDREKADKIKRKIEEHEREKFNVKVALKEDLKDPPNFEFAIYDNEIVLRLSIDHKVHDLGDGIVYFDDAVLRDVYRRRYKDIEAEGCEPKDFWEKPDIKEIIELSG